MKRYPILQSGFISLTEEKLSTPVKYNDLVISNVLSKDYRNPSNHYFFSKPISVLYNKWLSNANCLLDFAVREELLVVSKHIFNTPSFFKWVKLQLDRGDISQLHEAFLIDTLEYLTGQDRKIQPSQWISLLEKAIKSTSTQINIARFFNKEMYQSPQYGDLLPNTVNDILSIWVSKQGGYEDLLITLYVIFGNRPYITDVSENPRS